MWNYIESLPDAFFDLTPQNIRSVFEKPTLVSIPGKESSPLFLSILLHGNETSSLTIAQKWLSPFKNKLLPRSVLLFVGNVEACEQGQRFLPGQKDYNRIWEPGTTKENKMAQEVIQKVREWELFVSVDLHNNTGKNPYYACINKIDGSHLALASLFGDTTVYFITPNNVQSKAFSHFVPSVTLECGQSQDPKGIEKTIAFLNQLMECDQLPTWSSSTNKMAVYHSFCRIYLPEDVKVLFCEDRPSKSPQKTVNYCFRDDLELLNFKLLESGTSLGWKDSSCEKLKVIDENQKDISDEVIEYKDSQIRLKNTLIPSMLTQDIQVIYQDCLGYLMRPLNL